MSVGEWKEPKGHKQDTYGTHDKQDTYGTHGTQCRITEYWSNAVKNVKKCFLSMCDVKVSNIFFTEIGTALTTILPILFQYCYKYCYSDSRNLWAVMKAGGLAL